MAPTTLNFSKPHLLRSEREYDAAVAELDRLLDLGDLSADDEDRLEFLTLLVEAYDEQHYPLGETSTPQSIVASLLEANGMTRADLTELMGGRSRVSDFFSGKRDLSLGQIQRLRARFNVAADVLLPSPGTASARAARVAEPRPSSHAAAKKAASKTPGKKRS